MFIRLAALTIGLSLLGIPQAFAQTAAAPPAPWCHGGYSPTFTVSGAVETPLSFTLSSLSAFTPQTSVTSGVEYTGVLLWEIINKAGLANNPSIKNDSDRKFVVVTGDWCERAVFSIGELDPTAGGSPHQVIVAYQRSGQDLGPQGFAQIVVPSDKSGARWITNVSNIEVIEETAGPTS